MDDIRVSVAYNQTVVLVLPDGREVSVLLGYLEPGAQLPELDIMLPEPMTANGFMPGLVPSPAIGNTFLAKQIIIPVPELTPCPDTTTPPSVAAPRPPDTPRR